MLQRVGSTPGPHSVVGLHGTEIADSRWLSLRRRNASCSAQVPSRCCTCSHLDLADTCMLRQCCERCIRLFRAWEVIQQQPAATSSRVESGNEWTQSRVEGPVAVVCEAPHPMSVTQARMVGQALGHKHLFHKTPTGKLHSHPYRNQPLITRSDIHHHQPVTWEEGVPVAVWVWVWVYVPEHTGSRPYGCSGDTAVSLLSSVHSTNFLSFKELFLGV